MKRVRWEWVKKGGKDLVDIGISYGGTPLAEGQQDIFEKG